MGEDFVRHKQPWTTDEVQKLHRLAAKGMALKAIARRSPAPRSRSAPAPRPTG
jgi:hypothetical protein